MNIECSLKNRFSETTDAGLLLMRREAVFSGSCCSFLMMLLLWNMSRNIQNRNIVM